jgi:uncharacterized protein with NAD-binding domain and iron-sulfur cluster
MKTAIVVGGGLAGLATAQALATSGCFRPLVLESQDILGGKAASWRDADGALVEAGLHICFRYHRQLLALVDRLGASGSIAWGEPTLSYLRLDGDGNVGKLSFPRLPPPLSAAMAVARFRQLTVRDRLSALVGAVEATLSTPAWRQRYESISFAQWARQRGLSRALVANMFEPFIQGMTFLSAEEVSARAILDYIQAVGIRAESFAAGQFRGGTSDVLVEPIATDVKRLGGDVRTRCAVTSLLMEAGRIVGVALDDGSSLHADLVVAAVPSHALVPLMPEGTRTHPAVLDIGRLRTVPVISVIVQFDRQVGGPPGLRLTPGSTFNTWADRSEVLRELEGDNRSLLQFVVVPTPEQLAGSDAHLCERVIAEVRSALPGARQARVDKTSVTRTPRSFHAVVPGAEALRPPTDIGIEGLLLAGDYVRTGHNPNMESAVVSGLNAACRALELHA